MPKRRAARLLISNLCPPKIWSINVCNFQENGVRTRRAAIVNHSAIVTVNSLRVVNLLRVLFLVRRGPLGIDERPDYSSNLCPPQILGGRRTAQEKKNKFLGTEVPRNFSDQCSLDFAYFLCLFSGRRAKSSQELCSWELFFSYFRWFFSFRNMIYMTFFRGVLGLLPVLFLV